MSHTEPEVPFPNFQPDPQSTGPAPILAPTSPPRTQPSLGAPLRIAAVVVFCVGLVSVAALRGRQTPAPIAPERPQASVVQPASSPAPAARVIPAARPVSAEASPLPFYSEGGSDGQETVGLAQARDDEGLMPLKDLQQEAAKAQASTPSPAAAVPTPQSCPDCDGRAMVSQRALYQPGRFNTRTPFLAYIGKCDDEFLIRVVNFSDKTLMRVVSDRGEAWSVYLRPRETTTIKSKVRTNNFTLSFSRLSGSGMRRSAGVGQ